MTTTFSACIPTPAQAALDASQAAIEALEGLEVALDALPDSDATTEATEATLRALAALEVFVASIADAPADEPPPGSSAPALRAAFAANVRRLAAIEPREGVTPHLVLLRDATDPT